MKNIYQALLTAQKAIDGAIKDSSNPFYSTKYESLESVIAAIKEPLNNSGIVIAHSTSESGLTTKLIHAESGEFVETTSPLLMTKQDMQQFGSACTYAKRQNLKNLTNLPSEDDDGNSISKDDPKGINKSAALEGAKTESAQITNKSIGQYVMKCGTDKVKNKKLIDIAIDDLEGCIKFFRGKDQSLTGSVKESIESAELYLQKIRTKSDSPVFNANEKMPVWGVKKLNNNVILT